MNHKVVDAEKEQDENKVVSDEAKSEKIKVVSVNLFPPFPQRLRKHEEASCCKKFIDVLKLVYINLLFINFLQCSKV